MPGKKNFGSERRNFLRIAARYVVGYKVRSGEAKYDMTQTRDISQGWAIITTDCSFLKGEIIELTMKFPFMNEPVKVEGEVVDCRSKSQVTALYEVRIKFVSLDNEVFKRLGEFIERKGGGNE